MTSYCKIISIKNGSFVLLVLAALFFSSSLTFAQGGARISLQPADSVEGTLTVNVVAENVTDMYGAEVRLKYDPAILSVKDANTQQEGIQIEAGDLLPVNQGFTVVNKADESEGTITYAMTLLNPAPAVNGSGLLARVTFNVLQEAPSKIDVEKAKLVAVDLQTIPSEAVALAIDNNNQVAAATDSQVNTVPVVTVKAPETSDFPWWVVAVGVIVLGLAGLAGFMVMGGKHKFQPATPPQNPGSHIVSPQTSPQTMSPRSKQAMRRRPSAFK